MLSGVLWCIRCSRVSTSTISTAHALLRGLCMLDRCLCTPTAAGPATGRLGVVSFGCWGMWLICCCTLRLPSLCCCLVVILLLGWVLGLLFLYLIMLNWCLSSS